MFVFGSIPDADNNDSIAINKKMISETESRTLQCAAEL
jgi:hypothetical protein